MKTEICPITPTINADDLLMELVISHHNMHIMAAWTVVSMASSVYNKVQLLQCKNKTDILVWLLEENYREISLIIPNINADDSHMDLEISHHNLHWLDE